MNYKHKLLNYIATPIANHYTILTEHNTIKFFLPKSLVEDSGEWKEIAENEKITVSVEDLNNALLLINPQHYSYVHSIKTQLGIC